MAEESSNNKTKSYTFTLKVEEKDFFNTMMVINSQNYVKSVRSYDSIEYGQNIKCIQLNSKQLLHIFQFGIFYHKNK